MLKLLSFLHFCIYVTLASCGPVNNQQIGGRIVGGNDTTVIDHPYQASLEYDNTQYCGGVIIARTWILTSATCIETSIPPYEYYRVRVGTSFREIGGELIRVARIITHPSYYFLDFDIALVELQEPVTLSRSAQIIRLPDNGNRDIDGLIATVTGWGKTSQAGSAATVLQAVNVPIISQSVCADVYGPLGYEVTERMLCAGLWDGGKDACQGDGGGPLVIDSVLYGLASWSLGCAQPQTPGVYTNVGVLRDFITEHTGI